MASTVDGMRYFDTAVSIRALPGARCSVRSAVTASASHNNSSESAPARVARTAGSAVMLRP
jgi:hypothetical protein